MIRVKAFVIVPINSILWRGKPFPPKAISQRSLQFLLDQYKKCKVNWLTVHSERDIKIVYGRPSYHAVPSALLRNKTARIPGNSWYNRIVIVISTPFTSSLSTVPSGLVALLRNQYPPDRNVYTSSFKRARALVLHFYLDNRSHRAWRCLSLIIISVSP